MRKNILFSMAILFAIVAGFIPTVFELKEFYRQSDEIKLARVPMASKEELTEKFNFILESYKQASVPDDFFRTLVADNEFRALRDKYNEATGEVLLIGGVTTDDANGAQLTAARNFASSTLQAKFGIEEMYNSRQRFVAQLDPKAPYNETTTSAAWYLGYGWLWSMFVMFTVFCFRAQSFQQLMWELISLRMLLATALWPIFRSEYMLVDVADHKSIAAMAKFATVNMAVMLTAVLSAGMAMAQSGGKKGTKSKRSTAVFVDQSAQAGSGKKPEMLFGISSKKDGITTDAVTILSEGQFTQIGLVGKEVKNPLGATVDIYGGYRADFKRNLPDSHRFFAGARIFKSIKLSKSKNHSLNFFTPFMHYEQYVKPRLKSAFFMTGQVFEKYKNKIRLGTEFTIRKEPRSRAPVSAGPFIGYNFTDNARVEGLLSFSNTGPPRFRLRTVFSF